MGELVITPVPALVAVLLAKEKEKGEPLTRAEVETIRDGAACIAMTWDVREKLDDSRGYQDIDPEHAWEQWQEIRTELHEAINGGAVSGSRSDSI